MAGVNIDSLQQTGNHLSYTISTNIDQFNTNFGKSFDGNYSVRASLKTGLGTI